MIEDNIRERHSSCNCEKKLFVVDNFDSLKMEWEDGEWSCGSREVRLKQRELSTFNADQFPRE
jgi:hypothetical protein